MNQLSEEAFEIAFNLFVKYGSFKYLEEMRNDESEISFVWDDNAGNYCYLGVHKDQNIALQVFYKSPSDTWEGISKPGDPRILEALKKGLSFSKARKEGLAIAKLRKIYAEALDKGTFTQLPPLHPGEILREDFMQPLGLTSGKVARAIGVPRSRIERIVAEKMGISTDTALRLGRLFNTTSQLWMNLQSSYETRMLVQTKGAEFDAIVPLEMPHLTSEK